MATRLLSAWLALAALTAAVPARATSEAALWEDLKSPGHIAIIRHALAPGNGDPENFELRDCSTQRNLSGGGRRQARRTGEQFRENGIASATVYSSQWCRCLETGRLLGLGAVTELPPLNSTYKFPERRGEQVEELRRSIAVMDLSKPVVMSTHYTIIRALVGQPPRSGEIMVVRRETNGSVTLRGAIAPSSTQ